MPFTVTITEHDKDNQPIADRLKVTVDAIDLHGVFQAVNTPPPAAPKPKKPRSDKGITRGPKTSTLAAVGNL